MYCWGNSTHHELCIEGPNNIDLVIKPTLSKWEESGHIKSVSAGEFHVLYLTSQGRLYSCGNNEVGQLGRSAQNSEGKHPGLVETFKGCNISSIACGTQHSMAIDEWGQPFSWGSDSMGQLGSNLGAYSQDKPKIIKFLAARNVIQIACGSYHSVALTNSGELYAWGANNHGQCGLGTVTSKETTPQAITSLVGVPIALIVCGSNHTFALSKSGAVFGWGKNTHGQLGLQDRENRCYPTHLKTLRNSKICHISCGEDFTAFLTLDGGVFTCGAGEHGQTGHGGQKDELVPRKVMELMGSTVSQVACGRRHLLCLVGTRVLACGYGARGQLGCPHVPVALVPTPVNAAPEPPRKRFKSSTSTPAPAIHFPDVPSSQLRLFAGADHSFLITTADPAVELHKQIVTLTVPRLAAAEVFKDDDVVNQDLLAYLETVLGSISCLNGSFLLADNAHYGCNTKVPGVNLKRAAEAFETISRCDNQSVKELIFSHLTENIIKKVKVSPPDAEALRIFLTLPLYHEMRNPRRHPELQGPFAEAFNRLSTYPQRIVTLWWQAQATDYFEMLVDIFKSVIVYELMQPSVRANKKLYFNHSIIQILNTLTQLNKINFTNPKKPKIPAECFYIEDLSSHVDLATDYINWLSDQDSRHPHMCNYAFLFDVQCKSLLLKVDQQLQMQMAINRAATQIITRLVFDPSYEYHRDQFLNLTVSRNHIVRDTVAQISSHDSSQLKKPLRVEFVNEEAEDAGGVRKEFFLLLLKEIFDPVYGMFQQSDETHMIWFSNNPFEDDVMYYLIGAIYGLAIYNSIIIYVPFPLVLYKKLLGESVMLDDLTDLYPTLANSLKSLLDYTEDDVEEVFSLCFAVNTVVFDQIQVHPLKEGGEALPVTHENKEEYVELYVDFLLNKSVENQFKAFNQGFQKVCGGRIIKLFRSHELMSAVIGHAQYDWEQFEARAEYKAGYSSTDPQVRWFWEVFHELPLEDKKKFLLFLTGSDRVPIQGMKEIKIRIQPVADDRYFPVAHTCFNLLDLPRYKTKERLKYYLLQAIQQTQGFSLV
ncbi:probable E3 ubiquitin-protein ligase HERC4 [Plutella xylostella]|uniref:probable E3 ubiquitin-protein ligase HERC4 n=1 Tax=Plutella xylostella TaxID=51655 RepID=UPI002032D075|nr:probable E3 ubiquitin-protein ligase HERC4 [Plutella xylostella]